MNIIIIIIIADTKKTKGAIQMAEFIDIVPVDRSLSLKFLARSA